MYLNEWEGPFPTLAIMLVLMGLNVLFCFVFNCT